MAYEMIMSDYDSNKLAKAVMCAIMADKVEVTLEESSKLAILFICDKVEGVDTAEDAILWAIIQGIKQILSQSPSPPWYGPSLPDWRGKLSPSPAPMGVKPPFVSGELIPATYPGWSVQESKTGIHHFIKGNVNWEDILRELIGL